MYQSNDVLYVCAYMLYCTYCIVHTIRNPLDVRSIHTVRRPLYLQYQQTTVDGEMDGVTSGEEEEVSNNTV